MNLEDFFISEYEKLRRENDLLKEENANLNRRIEKIPKPVETAGLLDVRIVGTDVEAVKVIFASSYALQNAYRGKPTSWLEEKKADVGNALEWPEDEHPKAIDVNREKFAALIAVKVLGVERKYLVRNDCKLEGLNSSMLGMWCLAKQEGELVKKAKKALLAEMDKAIERMKDEEAKEAANDTQ